MSLTLQRADLEALDARVEEALTTWDPAGLEVLGYGEITCVLRLRSGAGTFACKRLPPFKTRRKLDDYRRCVEAYLSALSGRGIHPLDTEVHVVPQDSGVLNAYCIQDELPPASLGPHLLAECDPSQARDFFAAVLDGILGATGGDLGLDGQISNWVLHEGQLWYLDVTTPLIRDSQGRDLLDTELFLASMPPVARTVARRMFLMKVIDNYHRPRGVILDLLANLIKEKLTRHLNGFLVQANARLDRPITPAEIQSYYRSDARMWALLQHLRRLDRWMHRYLLRKTYPFLLPGRIERNL